MANVYNFNRGKSKGTVKEVGVEEIVREALGDDISTVSIISSGNYLDALLREIERMDAKDLLRIVNLVNKTWGNPEIELLIENNRILRNSEERERYVSDRIIGCGRVRDYTDFIPTALKRKAEDILALNPDYVSLGVGTGKLFVALYRIVKERGLATRLVGIVPKGENGIFNDHNLIEDEHGNLHYKKFNPRTLAYKLATPYTSYKEEILQALKEDHLIIEATNRDFKNANAQAVKRGCSSEYSGSAGFVLCDERIREAYGINDYSSILMVNTGNGVERHGFIELNWNKIAFKMTAAAASILIALGINYGIEEYQNAKIQHSALAATAIIASDMIGDKINTDRMSSSELSRYILDAKHKIGGPAHYW